MAALRASHRTLSGLHLGGVKKVAVGAYMQESALMAFPSHSMLSKR